jgi:hypothetical protein
MARIFVKSGSSPVTPASVSLNAIPMSLAEVFLKFKALLTLSSNPGKYYLIA